MLKLTFKTNVEFFIQSFKLWRVEWFPLTPLTSSTQPIPIGSEVQGNSWKFSKCRLRHVDKKSVC